MRATEEACSDQDHEHRPLPDGEIVADLNSTIEDLAVQPVDLPVQADEVLREGDIARGERLSLASDTCERAS